MKRGDASGASAKEQFQTPNKPPTEPSTSSNNPKGTSTLKRRSGTPASSASTFRSWKRAPLPSPNEQPTLTQIDFVTTQRSDDDDDLDYIGGSSKTKARARRDVIEIEDDSGKDADADYRPPAQRARAVRFKQDTTNDGSKLKSFTSHNENMPKRGRRKSGDAAKGKGKQQKDKTLTQMDYVRRYLKIEDDDDVKLEYTYSTPQRIERKSQPLLSRDAADTPIKAEDTYTASSETKRRKLAEELKSEETEQSNIKQDGDQLIKNPVTPQKQWKISEIPSSQSPESPGFAIISSSQFRGVTRSPLRRVSPSPIGKSIKEESPRRAKLGKFSRSPEQPLLASRVMLPRSPLPTKVASNEDSRNFADSSTQSQSYIESAMPSEANVQSDDLDQPPTTQRTIIYETDAESDHSEFPSDEINAPSSPLANEPTDLYQLPEEDELANEDSQDLPPMPQSGFNDEPGLLQSEPNLPSDASIYYRRPQQATQFPLEPIPAINTQKMAELFPEGSDGHQDHLSSPTIKQRTPQKPFLYTQTQTQTQIQTQIQTQTQSQDQHKESTEIVPESSPIVRSGNGPESNEAIQHGLDAPESVVQVVSSQPADRLHKKSKGDSYSQPRGILSRSQLLTSSVMESVPLPRFLLGSQDSAGEPYSDT
ncbi:hypothetical protein BDV25DRAFT_149397 [Aspergillus avenaceus]|uniref:Uncharacterized protein n=1 Tax=Aspergillus avenaceus TaxID=36643 RepID=A0A5N6U5B2_ASPAV|nr:hypothetical protein BDV25DRAFT_149397 [Aspergillus avenaceus]